MTVFITTDPGSPVRMTNSAGVLNIYQVPAARFHEFRSILGSGPFFAVSAAAHTAAQSLGLFSILNEETQMHHGDYMLVVLDDGNYQIATWTA